MSSSELHRVTFRFRGEWDVRYVAQIPEVGDFVNHDSEWWVVIKVEPNDVAVLVICEEPRPLET